jgi:hypothetical protein
MSLRDNDKAAIDDSDWSDKDNCTASMPSTINDVAATRLDSDNHSTVTSDVELATVLAVVNTNMGSEVVLPFKTTDKDTLMMELETILAAAAPNTALETVENISETGQDVNDDVHTKVESVPEQEVEAGAKEIETALAVKDTASEAVDDVPTADVSGQDGNDTSMELERLPSALNGNIADKEPDGIPKAVGMNEQNGDDTTMELETVLAAKEPAAQAVDNIPKTADVDEQNGDDTSMELERLSSASDEIIADKEHDNIPNAVGMSEQNRDDTTMELETAIIIKDPAPQAVGNVPNMAGVGELNGDDTIMELERLPVVSNENSANKEPDSIPKAVDMSEQNGNDTSTGLERLLSAPNVNVADNENIPEKMLDNIPKALDMSEQNNNSHNNNNTTMELDLLPDETPDIEDSDNNPEVEHGLETAAARALALEAARAFDNMPEASEKEGDTQPSVDGPSGESPDTAIMIDDSSDSDSAVADVVLFQCFLRTLPHLPITVLVRLPCHRRGPMQGTVHFHPLFSWRIHPPPPTNLLPTILACERPGNHKLCHRQILRWDWDYLKYPMAQVLELVDKAIDSLYHLEDMAWPTYREVWKHASWKIGGEWIEEGVTFGEVLMDAHNMGYSVVTLAVRNKPEDDYGFYGLKHEDCIGIGTPPENPVLRKKQYILPSDEELSVHR